MNWGEIGRRDPQCEGLKPKGARGREELVQSATTAESLEYLRNTEKASLAGSQCAGERIVGDALQGSDQEEVCQRGTRTLNHTCRDIDAI